MPASKKPSFPSVGFAPSLWLPRQSTPFLTLLLILFVSATLPATAQDRERQQREVETFSKVSFSVPGTLHLRQGTEHALAIEAAPDVLEKIETTTDDETLEIGSEGQSSWLSWLFNSESGLNGADVDVYVTAPAFEEINLAGSGDILGETPLKGDSLVFDLAGSGSLDLDVDVQRLEIEIAGSGRTHFRGQVGTAKVSIAGSGDVELPVVEELSVSIAGSGDVQYEGDPEVDSSISGSGSVRAKE